MKNYKLSEDFLQKMAHISAGYIPAEITEIFISALQTEVNNRAFTFSSESNLLRIITGMFDKQSFILDSVKYPHYFEILTAVAANSNYLTDILVRNPEFFYRIVNPSYLNKNFTSSEIREMISSTLSNYKTLNGKLNALRSLKRREILRIGLKDILQDTGLKQTTLELSNLAKEISSQLFDACFQEIISKYKIKNLKSSYCIIALGKLGGSELNYSSDIDLIIFYDKDKRYGKKEFKEILTETIYLFVELASSVSGGGYIYRVDLRLRPDGRNAPLCGTVNDYLNYYESRGEDWERQMLIKAGFAGGSEELYNYFMSYLQPFIYPSSFRSSPVEQIRKLKTRIENSLTDNQNIKLAGGGIRDVEFTVQTLQLINGYRNNNLRKSNTLEALESLLENKLINDNEFKTLNESYIIYRRIEHYLQLMNDLQTHSIPAEGELLSKLSFYLGFTSEKKFLNEIALKRKAVSEIFNSVTGDVKIKEVSKDIKFSNRSKAESDLSFLREGKGLLGTREFDMQSINAFQNIEPQLMKYLSGSINPDLVLQNFVRIIRSAGFPSMWYRAFGDKKFFNSFLTICSYSQRAVDLFSEDPELQEFFLSGDVFSKNHELQNSSTKKLLFFLSVHLCLGIIDDEKFSAVMSSYFFSRISELSEEYLKGEKFFVAAMGSLGTKEMTFASDIDLIFVVDEINYAKNQQKRFTDFLAVLKKEFKPFDTDCRLRPEGKSSQLLWDIKSYTIYIEKRARIWELQAFTKIDLICGSKKLFNQLTSAITRRLKTEPENKILVEIKEMRKKLLPADPGNFSGVFNIKKSSGGMTDIEFLVQYYILCSPDLFKKSRGKKIPAVLKIISDKLSTVERESILQNYKFLKMADLVNQNIFHVNTHTLPVEGSKVPVISGFMNFRLPEEFTSSLKNSSRQINLIYKKHLS